jgi:hypothetical protein
MANYIPRPKPTGITSKPPAKSSPKGKTASGPATAKGDPNSINKTRMGQDAALANTATGLQAGIANTYSQPMDWSKAPAAPVTGDYNSWVQSQMGNYNNAYDSRMKPVEQQQNDDFEQQMANRGIPMGSDLYNKQKQQLQQSQSDARTQAYASGQGQATQDATSLFGVGTQAHQNSISDMLAQRGQGLNDYNQLNAAQSGLATPWNTAQANVWQSKNQKTSGGGSGGGSAGLGGYNGTGMSYTDYLAAQQAAQQSTLQYQYSHNPQYQTQPAPSPWASGIGSLGSGLLAGVGMSLFK